MRAVAPSVSFKEELAGRETLAAIAQEYASLNPLPNSAEARSTQHYGDRISNAPGATSPKTARAMDGAPELTFSFTPPGRGTMAAIHEEDIKTLAHSKPPSPLAPVKVTSASPAPPSPAEAPSPNASKTAELNLSQLEIEQVHAFRICAPPDTFNTEEARRSLVIHRLLRQMPACGPDDIRRIDVRPDAGGKSLLVRVWTRVP